LCPVECAVLPLVNKFTARAREVFESLVDGNWRVSYDKGGSIGRRYARQDELGTKWCITIDGETDIDNTVTIRERDTKHQKRVKIQQLLECSSIESIFI
jgi:glycyl-tRNA synthetase